MKIFPSELVFFMLVKGPEESSSWWYFTPFFGPGGTNYEKGILQPIMTGRVLLGIILYFFGPRGINLWKSPPWSILSHFKLSKHETMTKFTFFGLIKLKCWRSLSGNEPLLSQVHKTYENGLITWWATLGVCYTFQAR